MQVQLFAAKSSRKKTKASGVIPGGSTAQGKHTGAKASNAKSGAKQNSQAFQQVDRGWRNNVVGFANQHDGRVEDPKKRVGIKTKRVRIGNLMVSMKELREGGYKVNFVQAIREKHVHFLMLGWEAKKLSPKTIANRFSTLRFVATVGGWADKLEYIGEFLEDPRSAQTTTSAREDKSWRAFGKKADEAIEIAKNLDRGNERFACLIALQIHFGLRLEEAIAFKPYASDSGGRVLELNRGTKGGRPRDVPILKDAQRDVIEWAKRLAGLKGYVGWPDKTLHASINKYYRLMKKLEATKATGGVTGHGLRHEYVHRRYEALTGNVPPVTTITTAQISAGVTVPSLVLDLLADRAALKTIMEEVGHSRISVATSYTGSFQALTKTRADNVLKTVEMLKPGMEMLKEWAIKLRVTQVALTGQRLTCRKLEPGMPIELLMTLSHDFKGRAIQPDAKLESADIPHAFIGEMGVALSNLYGEKVFSIVLQVLNDSVRERALKYSVPLLMVARQVQTTPLRDKQND